MRKMTPYKFIDKKTFILNEPSNFIINIENLSMLFISILAYERPDEFGTVAYVSKHLTLDIEEITNLTSVSLAGVNGIGIDISLDLSLVDENKIVLSNNPGQFIKVSYIVYGE